MPSYAYNGQFCDGTPQTIYTDNASFSASDIAFVDIDLVSPYDGEFLYSGYSLYYVGGESQPFDCPTPPPTPPPPTPPPPTPPPPTPPPPTPPPPTPPPPTPPPPTPPPPTPPPPTPPPPTPPPPTPPPPTPPPPTPPPPTPPPPTPPPPTPPPPTPPPPTPTPVPIPPPIVPEPPFAVGFYPSVTARGTGESFYYSKFKDSSFSFQYKDIYDNEITSDLQLVQNEGLSNYDFSYRVSLLTTGATASNTAPYLVASNFATNQTSLSFEFLQTKNSELFLSSSGERYYSLLFNVNNRGSDNSVLATIYHLPANIDAVSVEDYFSSQVSGVVNNVLTTWLYTGDGILTGFSIPGHVNSFITGLTSGLSQVLNWQYFPTGDVSGFAVTGYVNSGDFYNVYSGGNLVSPSEYEIKFTNPTPEVNFFSLPNGFSLNIVESTGNTGFLSTNYKAFIDGFEELSGDYSIDGNSETFIFNVPPPSGSPILIQEITGVQQLISTPLSGQIDFSINFDSNSVENYITRAVDIYTGANTGEAYSLSGFQLFKTVNFLENSSLQEFSIFSDEVPTNQYVYYKFVPKDDFGTGFIYGSEVSGYLFTPPEKLFYTNAIPPTLSFERRTGNFFTGYSSPADAPSLDGALIYQTGSSGQNLYLVKSGQWKTILPYEEISGNVDQNYIRYVSPPLTASSNGRKGDVSFSGTYLYAATGTNLWGRVQLLSW